MRFLYVQNKSRSFHLIYGNTTKKEIVLVVKLSRRYKLPELWNVLTCPFPTSEEESHDQKVMGQNSVSEEDTSARIESPNAFNKHFVSTSSKHPNTYFSCCFLMREQTQYLV